MESSVYDKLISHFGSPGAAAKAFRVTPQVVDNWRTRGVPKKRALEAEIVTDGAVSAHEVLQAAPPKRRTQ